MSLLANLQSHLRSEVIFTLTTTPPPPPLLPRHAENAVPKFHTGAKRSQSPARKPAEMGERENSRSAQEAGQPVAHAAILSYVRQPSPPRWCPAARRCAQQLPLPAAGALRPLRRRAAGAAPSSHGLLVPCARSAAERPAAVAATETSDRACTLLSVRSHRRLVDAGPQGDRRGPRRAAGRTLGIAVHRISASKTHVFACLHRLPQAVCVSSCAAPSSQHIALYHVLTGTCALRLHHSYHTPSVKPGFC